MNTETKWLTRPGAAQIIGVSPATLRRWSEAGNGPPSHRFSARTVRYRSDEVEAWLESKREN